MLSSYYVPSNDPAIRGIVKKTKTFQILFQFIGIAELAYELVILGSGWRSMLGQELPGHPWRMGLFLP